MIGARFGRLVALGAAPPMADGRDRWLMQCDCGNEKEINGKNLRRGLTLSCGCLQKERASKANGNHLMAGTPVYKIWTNIKRRCRDPSSEAYPDYGGRGITIHSEWLDDFAAFYAHVGPRPSPRHSIDRINNDKSYSPGNVRWATKVEQNRNRRDNKIVEYQGRSMPVSEAIEASGTLTHWRTVYNRVQRGIQIERALA